MPTGNEIQCTEDTFNADPATINPPNPTGYDLRLKKYVNGDDNSTRGLPGNTVGYSFVVQNLGTQSSTGVITVTDSDFTGNFAVVGGGLAVEGPLSSLTMTATRRPSRLARM